MQYSGKIESRLIYVAILNIIVLISVVVLSNFTFAKKTDLDEQTLFEITKHTSQSQNPDIIVGNGPSAIGVDDFISNKIFVANSEDNTVSVIYGKNNSKIADDIKVGNGPSAIGVDHIPLTDRVKIYIANKFGFTVSVIDGKNYSKIADDIGVGSFPSAIGVDNLRDKIYVANSEDNTVSVIYGKNNSKIADDIKVGKRPSALGVDYNSNTIFVANYDNNSVSIIDGAKNKKVGDIKVGNGPSAIGVDNLRDKIYVANSEDNTIFVIDRENPSKIEDVIKVGNGPSAIGVDHDPFSDRVRIYIANKINGTVTVIDGKNNSKIGNDIKVGNGPSAIGVLQDTIYVANSDNNTISVVDGKANKVVAKVMFNIEPFNAGHIECQEDKLIAPISQQFYIWSGSQCTAKPNQGFEFVSWQENLGGNSTQLLQLSSPPSTWDSILDFIHMKPNKPEATLNITKFGSSFTANFKSLPPPIPQEYLIGLFTIVASTIVGWSIPSIIGWINFKKRARVVSSYHERIKSNIKDDDHKIDEKDIKDLDELRDEIANDYSKGKISDQQYENMNNEIGALYEEIYNKQISSSDGNSGRNDDRFLNILKKEISNAFRKGKISNQQFENIKNEISVCYLEVFQKNIDSLNELSDEKRADLLNKITSELADAYGQGKLNELHYNLLKEKFSEVKDDRNITTD